MPSLDSRLEQCFSLVFADLPAADIPKASIDTVEAWDSLAAVTLLAVLEEEFQIEIDPTLLPDLTSYAEVRDHLRERGAQ